ncbi:maleylpyruvate isomerase family mycothiol-dependent enzyme [Gordonia sp. TBRC 11910]|uniref:Maleylpyruvate isomerase family mycothiol-dependent enzyme n=1 Tax=Gordonia asplenii TaxID=2725283 RepID=A0A848KT31_9ACTN|nr:maleylpyruvate isomerase family mycothiol-dependent enzyme [Gordonia asplenii]NMO02104.1 maleylpyruvate isomerase family mycothiol-dependent enzyme [Gordonia asplenii]
MDRLAVISAQSQRLADAVADVDPQRRCPTCPDWSAADLLWHIVHVQHFWAEILARNTLSDNDIPDIEASKPQRPPTVGELLALRDAATRRLVEQLAAHDDEQPLWSWWPAEQTVGFTRRMQTYEATMHRIDAELTAGIDVMPIAPDLATGVIDHAVDVMWAWMPDAAVYEARAVVELRAADTGQRWFVEVGQWRAGDSAGARGVRSTGAEATATVTGTVDDLARWAWGRGGEVSVGGDPAAVAAMDAVLAVGM